MNNEEIKPYYKLNVDEKEIIDAFTKTKLLMDQARYELFSYQLKDLIERYEALLEMRKQTQALLFDILEKIDQHGLAGIDVDYEKLGRNREAEADNIGEEVSVVEEYKVAFDTGLLLIANGDAEQSIITNKINW